MSGEKGTLGLLITQCVVTAVILLTLLLVRLVGGPLYAEWKNGWNWLMADNRLVDAGITELFGEPDGQQTEDLA